MDQNEYLKMAEVEDRMWWFQSLHRHIKRELLKARLRPGASVLDAGCGTGGLILRARQWPLAMHWTGIDFMPLACELARQRCGPDVNIAEASVTALPFEKASFDAVVSADVICQIDNPEAAMAEFHRVLRPGGVLVIHVPAYMWMWSYHDDTVHTKHRYTRPEIARLLHDAGFHCEQLTHWNALLLPVVWMKRKLFRGADDTSDVRPYPAPLDRLFRGVVALERGWLKLGGRWAWGTSILAVGRKPDIRVPATLPPRHEAAQRS